MGAERFVLAGTDYVFPRTANEIIKAYLHQKGIQDADIMVNYTPFGHSDWQSIVSSIKEFGSTGKKTAVISTLNGDANVPFYKELAAQGITADTIPVMAFSVGEEELSGMDLAPLVGHLAAWNYFMSIDTPENAEFIKKFRAFTHNDKRVVTDPIEASYIGFSLWVKAVEAAGTTDVDKVLDKIVGLEVPNLSGGTAKVLPNHHITKPVFIGEIQDDGQFQIVWETDKEVAGDAWSDYLPSSRDLEADWTAPINCGSYNVETHKCETVSAAQ